MGGFWAVQSNRCRLIDRIDLRKPGEGYRLASQVLQHSEKVESCGIVCEPPGNGVV